MELMIVVAVVAIVMAVALPFIQNARIGANEGSAVSSLKALVSANLTYKTRFRTYASALSDFSDVGLIDEVLGAADGPPGKSGYTFTYNGGASTFEVNAAPALPGSSGIRYFFVDTSGVIRFREDAAATVSDDPIDQ